MSLRAKAKQSDPDVTSRVIPSHKAVILEGAKATDRIHVFGFYRPALREGRDSRMTNKIATSRLLAGLAMTVFLFAFTVISTHTLAQGADTGLSNFTTLVPGADADPTTSEGQKYATGNYTLCDFFRLLANAVKILFELAAGGAIFLFLWVAFGMISNWGEAEKAQGAFKNLKNIFYGLAIMLGAWFLVNILILTLSGTAPVDDQKSGRIGTIFEKPWNNLDKICEGL